MLILRASWVRATSTTAAGAAAQRRAQVGTLSVTMDEAGFTPAPSPPLERRPSMTLNEAEQKVQRGENLVLVGPAGTGKRTFLRRLSAELSGSGGTDSSGGAERTTSKRVACVATRPNVAYQLDGLPLSSFVGLKPKAEPPSLETAIASLARHIRAINGPFAHCFPCLTTVDVLLLHGLELMQPLLLDAIDAVTKEERGRKDLPFGGLQVVATADFWQLPAAPSSPHTGYLYQRPSFTTLFPPQNQLPLSTFWKHTDAATSLRTLRALHGTLTAEDTAVMTSPFQAKAVPLGTTSIVDDRRGAMRWAPQFPKQPAVITQPQRSAAVRNTAFGQYLMGAAQHMAPPATFGLCQRLHLDVDDEVALTHPMAVQDMATASSGANRKKKGTTTKQNSKAGRHTQTTPTVLPAGTVGTVLAVDKAAITMSIRGGDSDEGGKAGAAPSERHVRVQRMRVMVSHSWLPMIRFTSTQFPLMRVHGLYPRLLLSNELPIPRGVPLHVDARVLSATNELGNLMAILPSHQGIFSDLDAYLRRDGMVHEPTRVYSSLLLARHDRKLANSIGVVLEEQKTVWCKNCKTHVPGPEFAEHWTKCIEEQRWCSDCSVTVPTEKWEAHCEKHTVVVCLDCGRALEWRYWDQHRRRCGAMLRELSSDNELLPTATRTTALEASIDRNDLHTVKAITRSSLPRRHTDVEVGARVRAM